jgi:phospholipid/cholesterol/gamma-HCH transport system substrate-binding protein
MSAAGKTIGSNNAAEVIAGAVVVLVALLFLGFTYMRTGTGSLSGYEITAKLDKADGMGVGTDVDISGIKVGDVTSLDLDPGNFLVTVHMNIRSDVKIPTDSSLQVTQSGVLGGQYVAIQPGGDSTNIAPGGEIKNAAGAVNLMGTIGHFMATPPSNGSTPAPAAPAAPKPNQPPPCGGSANPCHP